MKHIELFIENVILEIECFIKDFIVSIWFDVFIALLMISFIGVKYVY
jgi:hypothetical protein